MTAFLIKNIRTLSRYSTIIILPYVLKVNEKCQDNINYVDKLKPFLYVFGSVWVELEPLFCPHNYFVPFLKVFYIWGMVSDGVRWVAFHTIPDDPQEQKKNLPTWGKFFLYISSFYSVSFSSDTYSIISPG